MAKLEQRIQLIDSYTGGPPPTGYVGNGSSNFLFDDLSGTVVTTENRINVLQRAGVRGHALQNLLEAGRPFNLTAKLYFAAPVSSGGWLTALRAYQNDLIGAANGVALTQHGATTFGYDVISVQLVGTPVNVGPTANVLVGNITSGSLAVYRFRMIARVERND